MIKMSTKIVQIVVFRFFFLLLNYNKTWYISGWPASIHNNYYRTPRQRVWCVNRKTIHYLCVFNRRVDYWFRCAAGETFPCRPCQAGDLIRETKHRDGRNSGLLGSNWESLRKTCAAVEQKRRETGIM